MAKPDEVSRYVDAVLKEIDLVCGHIRPQRNIAQIHYGGGTPTAIPTAFIEKINRALLSRFDCIENPEIAIECHSGYMDESAFASLIATGFNRMSIGIQDFNDEVLKAVHRKSALLPIERVFEILRKNNIRINLDFIYGLPLQTPESFSKSIAKAVALSPDRLVTFSYAHLPSLFPRQAMLDKRGLPQREEKEAMFEKARALLLEGGYKAIGLDHFVREDDELYAALQKGELHRNFQGYCTRRTTGQVYAFGVTAISQLSMAYAQNTKNIPQYIEILENGRLPVEKGYALSEREQITREVITDLMCNEQINWRQIAARTKRSVSEVKQATAFSEQKMREFAEDGIIGFDDDGIALLEKGSPFIRNVAASLDVLLQGTDKLFSTPI
jgi:oxygen-independent coproporphyrinogen-3 oxidase